jgi:hypothetical protein
MGPWLARAVLVCVLLAGATDASADDGFLAETGFDFWAADDAQRATASVRWYPNIDDSWVMSFGARVGGERLQFPGVDVTAATAGGFVGLSHAVGRIWPTVTLGVDKPFQDGDTVDRETTGTLGARWFLTGRGSASYAVHLGAFRTDWDGAPGQPNRTGYGLFAGLHQARLSSAAWRALGPEALRDDGGTIGREIEFLGAGSADDYWGGMALDSFSPHGRTDVGIGLQRVCLDDPTNDLTACGFAGELRGEWHFGVRSGGLGEFSRNVVPLIGLSAGALAGPAHDYYDYTGSLWAGVRWQRINWPLAVHVAAVGRQLVAGDGFDDRTVGGLQVGLAFR